MQAKEVTGKDLLPWQGLTLACVRILQLYCRVFEQDFTYYLKIKEYVKLFIIACIPCYYFQTNLNAKINSHYLGNIIECDNHLNQLLCLHFIAVLYNVFKL